MQCTYMFIPRSLCAVTQQSDLRMSVHCFGSQPPCLHPFCSSPNSRCFFVQNFLWIWGDLRKSHRYTSDIQLEVSFTWDVEECGICQLWSIELVVTWQPLLGLSTGRVVRPSFLHLPVCYAHARHWTEKLVAWYVQCKCLTFLFTFGPSRWWPALGRVWFPWLCHAATVSMCH